MAYYTYILRSLKDGWLYVGSTQDVLRRLHRHNLGLVAATKHRLPLDLVWQEEHPTRTAAVRRELYLKSLEGSAEKKNLVSGGGRSSVG